jgi:phage terminase small subunit
LITKATGLDDKINISEALERGKTMDKDKKTEQPLKDKQLAFCREYIVDLNQTQAAIRAGYSEKTAGATASRLLKNVKIQDEINRLKEERAERTGITADEVVEHLARIAFMDIKAVLDWETKYINTEIGRDFRTGDRVISKIPVTQLSLKDMNEVDGRLIQSVKMGKHGISVELPDKMKALEMLAKHTGVYDDRPQTTVDVGAYKAALFERVAKGDLWDGFDNGGPDPEDDSDGED